ncbi:TPA: Gfo/Idh/MocA family oxidoreductase [Candidatus Poribacteria bacterium]|nr:Gfo/Idh/MocA family oxidoreductase [Candidatus Poribacteria bacterium]
MAKKLKVGIVGAGNRSQQHAQVFQSLEGTELVAFCDVLGERSKEKAEAFGLNPSTAAETDYHHFVRRKDFDAVSICASSNVHAEVAIAAAQAGKHILTEKPMAQTLAQCDEMIEAADANDVVLAVVFQNRFHRDNLRIKSLIESGRMGQIMIAREFGWTIHSFDLFHWLFGPVSRVSAEWAGDGQIYRDALFSLLRFENGIIGYTQSSPRQVFDPPCSETDHGVMIVGEKLYMFIKLWGHEIIFKGKDENYLAETKKWMESLYTEPDYNGSLTNIVEDFLNAVNNGTNPRVNGEEGRQSIELTTGIHKAALTHQTVSFPIEKIDPFYADPKQLVQW